MASIHQNIIQHVNSTLFNTTKQAFVIGHLSLTHALTQYCCISKLQLASNLDAFSIVSAEKKAVEFTSQLEDTASAQEKRYGTTSCELW